MAHIYGEPGKEYGDAQIYQQLSRLPDRFVVYAQPAVHSPLGSRYPDYVIVDQNRGVLVLEVKDWKNVRPVQGERAQVLISQGWRIMNMTNPVEQARQASIFLRKAFQQDSALIHHRGPYQGNIIVPVGYAGYLPNLEDELIQQLRRSWGYGSLFGKKELESIILLIRSLDNYPYQFRMNLDDAEKAFFCIHQLLFPQILFRGEEALLGSFQGREFMIGI